VKSNAAAYWHKPIIVRNMQARLGEVIGRMAVEPQRIADDVIHHDMILVWGAHKRVITGADLLRRLLRDIPVLQVADVTAEVV